MKEALSSTQKRLVRLNHEKIRQTSQLVSTVTKPNQVPQSGNKMEVTKKESGCTFVDLKALMREMDSLYNIYSCKTKINKVPVYDNLLPVEKTRNSMFGWWKPICTLLQMLDFPVRKAITFEHTEESILEILKDFTVDQKSRKNVMEDWEKFNKKTPVAVSKMKKDPKSRRGSNATQRMLERKERRKFALKEFESKGEKHFLVVRKQVKEVEEAEDIFADWKNNLAKNKVKKPRTRKISHRAERKEIIKSASNAVKPCTYAQAVQKNLKRTEQPAVEEVFECFASYVTELCDLLDQPPTPKVEDMADIFHPFRHNFHIPEERLEDAEILSSTVCIPSLDSFNTGVPTVKTAVKPAMKRPASYKASSAKRAGLPSKISKSAKAAVLEQRNVRKKDINLPKWQNLIKPTPTANANTAQAQPRDYKPETFFEDWIQNLEEPLGAPAKSITNPKSPKSSPKLSKKKYLHGCETFFEDWLHNLQEPEIKISSPKSVKKDPAPPTPSVDEDGFEDAKDGRRQDFAKVTKIKDKKRTQAQRRSTGKRVK